ncbi:MAG TPA: hypothetical protein VKB75_09100 [Jatrophihabitans sp.]|nr:hypothetical protein [Jatrophihabitans sp.]
MSTGTQQHTPTNLGMSTRTTIGGRWAWWGVAAGALGVVATTATNVSTSRKHVDPSIVLTLKGGMYHVGGALGYLTVACLLILAAAWRTHVSTARPRSIAARLVADGFTASAAALTLGYGWRLAMALYLPGGANADQFGAQARWFYYMLNDFGAFIGWLGVCVAAGAVAWLSLREKATSVWIGLLSLVPVLATVGIAMIVAIAGFPGVVGPIWLIVAFAGIALTHNSRA